MITHEEALARICEHVSPLGPEEVDTYSAVGRVLAGDVRAMVDSPPFNKAAMDGYAVREADVRALPADLELVDSSFAGQPAGRDLGAGKCVEVATGAPVPAGADMVVMVEHTQALPEGRIRVKKVSGHNICAQGEDVQKGQLIGKAGEPLTPLRVGVMAAGGHDRLTVYRRPSIAVLCTGTEVREPGETLAPGQIFNSNGPMLCSLLRRHARELHYLGIAGDVETELRQAVRRGLRSDVFVLAGGVSVGKYDLVPDVLSDFEVAIAFHGCAIKPGKPTLFGVADGSYVFGLPGNPQSAFVIYHVLLRPMLARVSGRTDLPPAYRRARMAEGFRAKPGRKRFVPCRMETPGGELRLRPVEYSGSADITGASAADAFFVVPSGTDGVKESEVVEFFEVCA